MAIWSCQQTPPPPDLFAGAQTIQLTGIDASLKLPTFFIRSSPKQLVEDLPYMKIDTNFLHSIELFLDGFKIDDQELDILVDTTSDLRCLVIANAARYEINEESGKILNEKLGDHFREMDEENLFLEIHKIDSKLKINSKIELLKYKYEFVNTLQRFSYYHSLFFLSNPNQSLIIFEFSIDGNDVEDYLWTMKG